MINGNERIVKAADKIQPKDNFLQCMLVCTMYVCLYVCICVLLVCHYWRQGAWHGTLVITLNISVYIRAFSQFKIDQIFAFYKIVLEFPGIVYYD